jgi:hypothetical protein
MEMGMSYENSSVSPSDAAVPASFLAELRTADSGKATGPVIAGLRTVTIRRDVAAVTAVTVSMCRLCWSGRSRWIEVLRARPVHVPAPRLRVNTRKRVHKDTDASSKREDIAGADCAWTPPNAHMTTPR